MCLKILLLSSILANNKLMIKVDQILIATVYSHIQVSSTSTKCKTAFAPAVHECNMISISSQFDVILMVFSKGELICLLSYY